jgi:hypothetical protein
VPGMVPRLRSDPSASLRHDWTVRPASPSRHEGRGRLRAPVFPNPTAPIFAPPWDHRVLANFRRDVALPICAEFSSRWTDPMVEPRNSMTDRFQHL